MPQNPVIEYVFRKSDVATLAGIIPVAGCALFIRANISLSLRDSSSPSLTRPGEKYFKIFKKSMARLIFSGPKLSSGIMFALQSPLRNSNASKKKITYCGYRHVRSCHHRQILSIVVKTPAGFLFI